MALRIHAGGTPTYRLDGVPGVSSLSAEEQARAEELFEALCAANSLKNITSLFQKFCECVKLRPNDYRTFYTRLKERMSFSWKWKSFQSKMDKRAAQKDYSKGSPCSGNKVLIVGAGPCGLRAAIEAALLGAKVVVLEKRDRFSRNNVLHLWPFTIADLRNLGAKKFYPKFCGGSVDHISIRILQCILLKISLLLGVEVHYGVSFLQYIAPPEDQSKERIGWRAQVHPADHDISSYEFDVLIGADGRRNTLQGFQRKVFRGMLAIAITANFINRNTPEEHNVPELSGVARIYNQQFFKDLHETTRIDLENIVYYKDATHYFVMTAKKQSLLIKGVLKEDYADSERLLDRANIDRNALVQYAFEAAQFSTNNRLPDLQFAINPTGDPDVHVFDFTNMYAAENASRIAERHGHRLLINLVGDSLVEPFWPLGTGCAHGFLGVFDAAWMMRQWGLGHRTPLQLIAEREAIYRALTSVTPEHLCKNISNYSIDPLSRYVHIDFSKAKIFIIRHLFDSDSKEVDKTELSIQMQRRVPTTGSTPKRLRRDTVSEDVLLEWCCIHLQSYGIRLENMDEFWNNAQPLSALIHRFRPELLDYYLLNFEDAEKSWIQALKICEEQLGFAVLFNSSQMVHNRENIDSTAFLGLISQFYELFKREKPGEFVAMISMDSSPLEVVLSETKRRNALAARKQPVSPTSTKRRMALNEHPKRRRPSAKEPTKRRISVDPAEINMGAKIKFLENAFNPKSDIREHRGHPQRILYEHPLGEKMQKLEQKLRDDSTVHSKPEPSQLRINADVVEQLRQELRLHGISGLEAKYSPEIIKLVIFEDKKKEMMSKLSGEYKDDKFTEIDDQIKRLDTQLREGNVIPRGLHKVASMADDYATVLQVNESIPETHQPAFQAPPAATWAPQMSPGKSNQICYFCGKRVYLAERKSVEGLFFHRVCFKCHHCNRVLQLNGDYTFDRYDPSGGKFYCLPHYKHRKYDLALLASPSKETPVKRGPPEIFTFARFPSRENVLSSSPIPPSPRHAIDEDEDDDVTRVLDDEQVLTHNFGGTVLVDGNRKSLVEDDTSTSATDSDDEDSPLYARNVVGRNDWYDYENAVENWKRKVSTDGVFAKDKRPSISNTDSSGDSGEFMRNAYDDSGDSEPLGNVYNDSNSPSSYSDQECDQEVSAVTSVAVGGASSSTVPNVLVLPTVIQLQTDQTSTHHQPSSITAKTATPTPSIRNVPKDEIFSVNGSNVLVQHISDSNCRFSILQPTPQRRDSSPYDVTVIPTDYYASPKRGDTTTTNTTPSSAQLDESFTSDEYVTPPVSRGSSHRKSRTNDIKWDSSVIETSKRLRDLRVSDGSASDVIASTPGISDEVFFSPVTSFPPRPRQLDLADIESVKHRLDFAQMDEDSSSVTTPATPSSREELKLRLHSVTQEKRAAARARAKLKSDDELGIKPGARVMVTGLKDRRSSGSSTDSGSSGDRLQCPRIQPALAIDLNKNTIIEPKKGAQRVTGPAEPVSGRIYVGERFGKLSPDARPSLSRKSLHEGSSSPSDNAENYFTKRAAQLAEKHHKLETTKLLYRAQETQRWIQETELHLKELDDKLNYLEKGLKGDVQLDKADDQLQNEWFSTSEERKTVQRQLDGLKLTAEILELEDRQHRGQDQLRRVLSMDDDDRTPQQKEEERRILDEILSVRKLKDNANDKLAKLQRI